MIIVDKKKAKSFESELSQFKEGFRAGKTPEMISKLMNVISKKANVLNPVVSKVPDYYSNKYGTFVGFFVKYNLKEILRFNFQMKGSSNQFYSIDFYNLKKMRPYYTIDLLGFNVVEVIDYVIDILNGEADYLQESTRAQQDKLEEMITYPNALASWINADESIKTELKTIVSSNNRARIKADLNSMRPKFERYLLSVGGRNSRNAETAFIYGVKHFFSNEGVSTDNVPAVAVNQGLPENLVSPGRAQETAYNSLMDNEHIFKFKALRIYCLQIKKGNDKFKSLYIYGDGGIGKSYWVNKILGNLPNARVITGKLKGYTGLVRTLYENRNGAILILDDTMTDAEMSNPTIANILKAALDPDPPRKIEVISGRNSESFYDRGKFYLNESDYSEFKNFEEEVKEKKRLHEEMEFVDITEPIIDDSPSEFYYNSVTIFITNYKKVPQPINDRCWILQMEFNNKQILDLIENSLTTAIPDGDIDTLNQVYESVVPSPTEQTALELLRGLEARNLIPRKLSFRVFNRVVALMEMDLGTPEDIEAMVRIELGN